jgi:hypothetical protein
MVGRALPPGIPEEIWDLAAQRAWVAAAVTATASVLPEGERPSDGWQRLAMALSDALVGPVQRAFLANLRRIEGTVRVVPRELRVAWIFTGQLEVEIELRTEGFRELLDATVVTQIVGRTSGDTWGELPGLGHVAEGVHLRTTDPPRQLKLTGPCPPEVKEIRCRVSVASRTQDGYTCAWPLTSFKPEEPRPSPHVAFTWGQLPQRFFASQERVRQWKTGVLIVGAEPVCAPGMLAVALAQGAGSTLVDLDELLADAGPGRARPRLLTAEVVLALLDGAPSLETAARRAREQGPGALARNDVSRVVVHPCEETLRRLFAGEESCGWQLLGERLKSHGRDGASPVIVFLVSDEMAVHLGIRLGGSARSICLSRPPTPEEGIEDLPGLRAELFATLWRQGLGPEEAREIFERADEDLRVLGDWLANRRPDGRMTNLPPPSSLTRWARVDLRRLSPGDLLRVLLLYSICSELPLSELQPGMVLGSGFKKTRKKTTEPEPLGSGAVLTRSLLKVLSRPTRRSRNFPVAGFLPGRPTRVPAERGWLEHYIRLEESNALRLERLGFTRRLHGVHRLRPLYQQALDQLLSQASCDPRTVFLDLSPHGSLLDAIELASLAKLASEDENVLARGDPQQKHLFRAIGRLWTRESHSKPQNARDCIALSSFLAGDKTRPCVVRPSDPGKPILEALGPDHFTLIGLAPAATGGMLQYLAFSDEAPSPASWIGVRNALRAAVTAEESVEALLILLGRGIEDWPDPPPGEPLIVVREAALRSLLVAERPSATFWAMVRARVGLTRISPYRDSVALPPGSPLFVGRRRILDEILHRLPERSFLVVGPRQMGKTSLLNRVFHEARSRAELLFVRLDTQGMERREELRPGLVSEYRRLFGQEAPDLGSYELIKDLASHARERGARAVFLINEIDGLLEEDPRFLSLLRGMADASEAAFVLVGYATAVAACRDPWGPLYHFTSGYPGSKAFRLSVLEAEETGEIMRWLEEPPLGLSWATPRDRTQALSLLQECAYGIPWFLQQVCARLVERLERQAAWLLRADDLRAVLAAEEGESALLGHLHATNFSLLMKKPRERRDLRAVMTPEDRALNLAIRALLLAAVGRIYFAETRDTHFWSGLRDLDERTLAFTPEEARNWLNEEVDAHLNAREKRRVQRYLRAFPIEDLLSHLCLTLFLVPADEDLVLPRYAFLKHIYPIELRRAAASGRNLGDRLLETLVELHRVARELQPEETPW